MHYTNVVSVRTYADGSRGVQINGRDIPDIQHIASNEIRDFEERVQQVTITFLAAQYNVLDGDQHAPPYKPVPKPVRGLKGWWQRVMGRR
jgi:hypothetical protein